MTRCRTWIAGLCLALAGSSPAVAVDPGGPAANEPAAQLKGAVDGKLGKQAEATLRAYQKSKSLEVTGRPDEATLAHLGVYNGTHAAMEGDRHEMMDGSAAQEHAAMHHRMEPGAMHDRMHSKTMDGSMHAKAAATQPKAPTAATPK